MQRCYDDCVVGAIVPNEILAGILTVLFTVVYVQWNRRAASIDAIAYAAKIRQQQQAVDTSKEEALETIDDVGQENSDVTTNTLPDNNPSAENTTSTVALEDTEPINANSDDDNESQASPADEAMSSFNNNTNNQWRCACEGGFLPAGMLQSLGGAEAVFNMGIGACYHTKGEMK